LLQICAHSAGILKFFPAGPTLSATDIAELDRLMVRTEEKLKDF